MNLIELEKDDVLVIRCEEQIAQIKETFKLVFDGVNVMLLDSGLSLDVLRKAEVEALQE